MAYKGVNLDRLLETVVMSVVWTMASNQPIPWPTLMGLAGMAASVGLNFVSTEDGFVLMDNGGYPYVKAEYRRGSGGDDPDQVTVYPASVLLKAFELLDMEVDLSTQEIINEAIA